MIVINIRLLKILSQNMDILDREKGCISEDF